MQKKIIRRESDMKYVERCGENRIMRGSGKSVSVDGPRQNGKSGTVMKGCSCTDNSIRIYQFLHPSQKEEINRAILMFMGDL